jgi:ParB-like chromosome segregation protein Spo0J
MARLKDLVESAYDAFRVDPRKLLFDELNPRDYDSQETKEHIRWLADNIKQNGVKVPIEVRMDADKVYVTDGGCRVRASLLAISEGADLATIPAMAETRYASQEDRLLSMLVRNTGKSLSALEQADVFARLLAFGWSEVKVVEKTGYSMSHVTGQLKLRASAPELKQSVSSGEIAATEAVKIIRSHGEDAPRIASLAIEVAKSNGKTKATAKHVAEVVSKNGHSESGAVKGKFIALDRGAVISAFRDIYARSNEPYIRQIAEDMLFAHKIPLSDS